jgi:hypothetical protein
MARPMRLAAPVTRITCHSRLDMDLLLRVDALLRGDLYFAVGKLDLARSQYEMAGESASPAATEANARLIALTRGGVARHQEAAQRRGANCAMCHGK